LLTRAGPQAASASLVDACHARATYVPRSTQGCAAVAIVREHWPAFRERVETHAGPLPAFVRDEMEAFAACGNFEQGFLVVECRRCGDSLRVPFACYPEAKTITSWTPEPDQKLSKTEGLTTSAASTSSG
jgi:hypothetical protein